MGIQNLMKLLREHAPESLVRSKISDFEGYRVGIDASLVIYQWSSVGISRRIVNSRGQYINHIQGAFFRTVYMLEHNITPVYIFDGAPPAAKAATITRRKELRTTEIPADVFYECAKLLDLMHIEYIYAPSEAEAQAAYMTMTGDLDAVATEDTDAIVYFAAQTIRGLDTSGELMLIKTADLLSRLGLTKPQFIDLCILLGSDYTSRTLPGIGPKRALALIKKYQDIESILEGEKITPPVGFDYRAAREVFTRPKVARVLPQRLLSQRSMTRDDIDKLENFLITTHGLAATRVKKSLAKLAVIHHIRTN